MKYIILIVGFSILWSCKPNNKQSGPNEKAKTIEVANEEPQPETVNKVKAAAIEKPRFQAPEGWLEFTEDMFGFTLDIKYATTDNFVDEVMYNCGKCFLLDEVGTQLQNVRNELKRHGYGIKLFDCYRPAPVQERLWQKVPNASYVTPPKKGSMHNRGAAVDLTLVDKDGVEQDMGTPFDFFGEEAHHTYKKHDKEIQRRRDILKGAMEYHGFKSIRTEWWHYSIPKFLNAEVHRWEWECE